MKRWVLIITLLGCACASAVAQCSAIIPLTITTRQGTPIHPPMTADELFVTADGLTLPIEVNSAKSRRLIILLDHSSSMDEHWRAAKSVLSGILDQSPPDLQLQLFVFHQKMETATGRHQTIALVDRIDREVPAPRSMQLYQALTRVLTQVRFGPGDLILAITDGLDEFSSNRGQLRKKAIESGVRISGIVFQMADTRGLAIRDAREFAKIAEETGGAIYLVDNSKKGDGTKLLGPDFVELVTKYYEIRTNLPPSPRAKPIRVKYSHRDHRTQQPASVLLHGPARIPGCAIH